MLEVRLAQCVQLAAHVVCRPVRGKDFYALKTSFFRQQIDVFQPEIAVQRVVIDGGVEVGSQFSARHDAADVVLLEAIGEYAVFVHHIGDKNESAAPCNPFCLAQCLQTVFIRVQMVHRAKDQRDVERFVVQKRQIPRISRPQVHFLMPAFQNGKVFLHEFHGRHRMAFPRQCNRVPAGSRTNVRNARLAARIRHHGNEVVNEFHRRVEFHLSVPGGQPMVLVEFAVIAFQIGHRNSIAQVGTIFKRLHGLLLKLPIFCGTFSV